MIALPTPAHAPFPNREAVIRHLAWLSARILEHSVLRLEIAWGRPETGPRYARTYAVFDLAQAADFACWINRKGNNVYVGTTLKHPETPPRGRTAAHHAVMATCLPIDIDTAFALAADRFASIASPQALVITGTRPSTRGQLFARLDPTTDLNVWERLHAHVVKCCGGDENALGRNRLMRLGGTVSYPSPAKVARGYITERTNLILRDARQYSVADLSGRVPPRNSFDVPPVPPLTPALPRAGRRSIKPALGMVQAALATLPQRYADERSLWIRVGFALHEFDPGALGLSLWQAFSNGCPAKASVTDFPKIWQSFAKPNAKRRVTADWLLSEARRHRRTLRGSVA